MLPLMLKTSANPAGPPLSAFDQLREAVIADRAQFFEGCFWRQTDFTEDLRWPRSLSTPDPSGKRVLLHTAPSFVCDWQWRLGYRFIPRNGALRRCLAKKVQQFRVHFLRVRPGDAMRAVLDDNLPRTLDQFRGPLT